MAVDCMWSGEDRLLDCLPGWLVSNAKYLSVECAVKHVNFRQFEFY